MSCELLSRRSVHLIVAGYRLVGLCFSGAGLIIPQCFIMMGLGGCCVMWVCWVIGVVCFIVFVLFESSGRLVS